MVRFLINIPEDLRDDLRRIARPRGQTLNGLIRQILWDWVRKNEKAGTLTRERTKFDERG